MSSGLVPFFGSLNDSDGGHSQRYSLQAEWHRADDQSATKVVAYGFYYDLDLFSDFTYFLVDPVHGDQFEQSDRRWVAGLDASHTLFGRCWDREMENTFGLQAQNDWIQNGIYQTEDRVRMIKTGSDSATTRQDRITQTEMGLYWQDKIQWMDHFRTVAGVRGDIYNFDVNDLDPANSGSQLDGLASPKLSLIFGPWAKTEVYLQGGFGFHSNDGRAVTTTTNSDGSALGGRAPGLVRTRGAEIGVRTLALPGLQSTISLWCLHSDSELLFDGDTGDTIATPQPSNRYGIEWANYYAVARWLDLDFDYANSIARFTRPDSDGGTRVPEAVGEVISAGITAHDLRGFSSSLRLRYFGPRDLISTGTARSGETVLLNLHLGYALNRHWTLSADVLNLLDRRDHDIDYYYESQMTPSSAPSTQIHFHPVEPIQARVAVTARF